MCTNDDKFFLLLILIAVLFFLYIKDNSSRPLNFDTFFKVNSSTIP